MNYKLLQLAKDLYGGYTHPQRTGDIPRTKMAKIVKTYGKDFGTRSAGKLCAYLRDKGYGALGEWLGRGTNSR